jgi:hypothetical protein
MIFDVFTAAFSFIAGIVVMVIIACATGCTKLCRK